MKLFGVKRRKLPLAMIANSDEVNELFKYKGLEYSAAKLNEFATKWENGELKKGKTNKHVRGASERHVGDKMEIDSGKWDAP
jgi:hypothetical protein